ncbi:MAG: HAD family hydrolase [Geminicoccaceae bacterium]
MVGEIDVCFYGTTSGSVLAEKRLNGIAESQRQRSDMDASVLERPRCLNDAAVLTLDGYGTLVDRENGVISALMPWLHDVGVTAGRGEILRAFAQAERASLSPGISYRSVLIRVHDTLAEFFGVDPDRKAAEDFASSIRRWPVHPDAPVALAYLKQHFQLVVLTNADHASFAATNEALGVEFDAVYTAEDAGTFKPDAGMFSYLLSKFEEAGIEKRQVLHVAGSIRFDHVPAKRLAMNTCWIHRKNGAQRLAKAHKLGLDVHPDFRFRTLGGLADAHWAEVRER